DEPTSQGPTTTLQAPLKTLYAQHGQSVWLDYIQRCMIRSGELHRLIEEEGIRGVTSNPAIFQKAIAGTTDYDKTLTALAADPDLEAIDLYEQLAIEDIQAAADSLKPLYDKSNRQDGYVSLEVSPYLANDTEQTLEEARRLWAEVHRPNLMVKVPATAAGIPVIQQLISEGINVNVTLLFSQEAYRQVADAYLTGLETFAKAGGDVSQVASVASFFISRIDTAVDGLIAEKLVVVAGDIRATALLESLQGKAAIANAKLAYKDYVHLCFSDRWTALAQRGAQPQRLLWASTGTKNPHYSDVLYIEELIGPDTVNTTPPGTLSAFVEHGKARASLAEDVEAANVVIASLGKVDIDFSAITDRLLLQGVQVFQQAFDQLLQAIEEKVTAQK
ncbi:MAG: transaldolase, partial [Cyanobacteria bacterium J06598_3]